jgi:(E)-4-hydroxy-3-methylbut-2-enyl-diphosphate synthase
MVVPDTDLIAKINYCNSFTQYSRRVTREVRIGDIPLGGNNPIRVQSMTTVDTMDTEGSIAQVIRMVDAGCEYVRITAPSIKEAQNLENIKKGLIAKGYHVPLIADIHFTPNAAELAARIVEKVRVNPGNYADKKKFEVINYTDESYAKELDRMREKFTPLVKICKEYGTAMRIGTNHGSLSDRILSRYGDTPLGMVESALEFLRICEDLGYYDIVLSMKASNTQVMVQAYRLLVQKLQEENLQPYPLHLGVTEAGDGEDGRIKSAVGIGTLLEEGLGDTVRVSLTEEPEYEAPVAQTLVDRYHGRELHAPIKTLVNIPIDPFSYKRRSTVETSNFGGDNVPRVIADFSKISNIDLKDLNAVGHFYLSALDKWSMNDLGTDYIYTGSNDIDFMLPNGLRQIVDYALWVKKSDNNCYPILGSNDYLSNTTKHKKLNFVSFNIHELTDQFIEKAKADPTLVGIISTSNAHAYTELRRIIFELIDRGCKMPIIINRTYENVTTDELMIYAATDVGGLLIDGLGDGIMLTVKKEDAKKDLDLIKMLNQTSFGILQAARTRMTKTEYISCPSCGRTLFNLQETTAMIRKRTDHLKGVKIGIMGCIVNGPGEMADADYGYVGSGKGKITLYRGQEVVERSVASEKAVDKLIDIIKKDGKWLTPVTTNEN